MSWLIDPATRALTAAMDGYARREQAIASNLANIDTPNYKPVRVDFESVLAAATQDAMQPGGTAMNPPTAGQPAAMASSGRPGRTSPASRTPRRRRAQWPAPWAEPRCPPGSSSAWTGTGWTWTRR